MDRILILAFLIGVRTFVPAQKSIKPVSSNQLKAINTNLNFNEIFNPLKWRCIGPFRGGRSVATSGVLRDKNTYYMGTTGGGVWKTDDLGNSWINISDGFFKSGSVGAIAVSESDPNLVFVGMGEHAVRGVMTHHGDGVYKSSDAGKTWQKTGLDKTQHISRIIIHPQNPDIVFIAAQGSLYGNSLERGVFKTTDGGKNWTKVLFVDEMTGCSEISMDMNNPLVLYAAMWEHGRLPWKIKSGGRGSGLYKSVDGGNSWVQLKNGLPDEMGKMAISVCRSNPEKVYALIESDSEKTNKGLFVSNDAGINWSLVSNDHRLVQRAWYYIELFTDPKNENTIFVLSAQALKSIDGGKSWEEVQGPHGDYHDLWINPNEPKNMAIADDGGVSITVNNGKTWSLQTGMPTAQMYRINTDNSFPYRIYGGQQDNSSISIASRELGSSGISRESWTASAGGESAFLAFDPDNPRYILGGSYQGTIEVLDTKAKAGTNIMAAPIQYLGMDAKDMKYRFNWNAPIIWSQHEPNTYFHGAQFVLRTTDFGKSWTAISPDLTRNEKEKQGKGGGPYTNEAVGAENYGTLSYIIESPHEKGVIWTGSDDGLVHLTKDGGLTWHNVTPSGLKECLINAIEVSPHDPATVYIATTRYKFNDHTPGLYKTTDYGKTWEKIISGIDSESFTRVVREDPIKKNLLFAGTENGVYISVDGGHSWKSFQLNLPVVPITDLKIHQGNLIAATSGRSFWILDDLFLIRQYAGPVDDMVLYQSQPTILCNGSSELDNSVPAFKGTHPNRGVNPATGVVIYYHLPEMADSTSLTLQIFDEYGQIVRSFSSIKDTTFQTYDGGPPAEPVLSKNKGLNRFVWNMRYPTIPGVKGVYIEGSYKGHKCIPGRYQLFLKTDQASQKQVVEILPNPLYITDADSYIKYNEIMLHMEKSIGEMHQIVNTMHLKSGQLDQLLSTLHENKQYSDLHKEGNQLLRTMKQWDEQMVQRKSKAYDDVENFPNKFSANYMFLLNQTESDLPRVNQPSFDILKELDFKWSVLKQQASDILNVQIPELNKKFWAAGKGAIWK